MKIKVCGMKDRQNLEKLVALSPDYVGFIFYPKSKRYAGKIDPDHLISVVPSKILKVGVFVNSLLSEIVQTVNAWKLNYVQLHGDESPEYCREISSFSIKIIKAFHIDENFDFGELQDYKPYCDFFLFDTKSIQYGGTGLKFDWRVLEKYDNEIPLFLSGGISPEDAGEIKKLNYLNIHALDINSRFEIEPGIKDIIKTNEFFKNIKG